MIHQPVLLKEVLEYLQPKIGNNTVDCTLGFGGHTTAFLQRGANVLGIEIDKDIYNCLADYPGLIKINSSYIYLEKIVKENNFQNIQGILFDLGVSMWHFTFSGKGFTFRKDEPLDMRVGDTILTAKDLVNTWREQEIANILKEYSQERFSQSIAKAIARERQIKPITTTFDLIRIIEKAVPFKGKIHKSTKTFQALRMAVNSELENIKTGVSQAFNVLMPRGRLALISFHSLEDKIVKEFFKEKQISGQGKVLTKKPIKPNWQEVKNNKASRSAKLRVIEKTR